MGSDYVPPRKLTILAAVLGGLGAGIMATVGSLMDWGPAIPPPLLVEDIRDGYVERNGRQLWRVELDVVVRAACEVIKVDRTFTKAGGGQLWRQVPVASYIDETGMVLGSSPYTVDLSPGRVLVWHEYEITRPVEGYLIVDVFATGCPPDAGKQFSGPVGTWTRPFDWTNRLPPALNR